MKRDMSFTSQILLEMKSNEFWTSPWQQLRLINHCSAQIFMHPDFMNPRLNLHLTRQTEFDNRRSLVWIWCDNYSVPSVPSLRWAPVFCPGSFCSWLAAPAWCDSPAEPPTRRGKDEEEKISFKTLSCHLPFISSSEAGAKENIILGNNSPLSSFGPWRGFSKPLTRFHQNYPGKKKTVQNFL